MSGAEHLTREERNKAIDRLSSAHGIGHATAERLVEQLGITTFPGLLQALDQGRLNDLPGMNGKHLRHVRRSVQRIIAQREGRRMPDEPRRVPPQVNSGTSRASAGCLGLFILPWFLLSLLIAFVSAGMPLMGEGGFAGVISGILMMSLFVPMASALGGFTVGAFRRAAGHDRNLKIPMKAAGGLGLSVVAIFIFTTIASIFSAVTGWLGGAPVDPGGIIGAVGILGFLGIVGTLIGKSWARDREEKRRRKRRESPPRPPWENPLARTEKTSMIAEALANQYNVITQGALVALSIVLWNPLPALIGGGLELFWLALVPDSEWFRNSVEAKHRAMAEQQARERREEQLEYLDHEQVERHRRMAALADSAREAMAAARYPFDTGKVNRLVDHHLWLMELENYYSDQRDPSRIAAIDDQLAEVQSKRELLSGGRMAQALDRRIDILAKRKSQLEEMGERVDDISEQIHNLEDAVRLITESALSSSGPQVAAEIDDVLLNLHTTEEVVLDFHAEEDELERQIEQAVVEAA
jgi:predicted  nucleic acid-binding Zn-ribbon protein